MKTVLALTAATLFAATAAIAQTTTAPSGSMATSPTTTAPSDSTVPSTAAPTTSTDTGAMPPAGTTASADGLTQDANGKWWSGDRAATKAEIKAHKKSMTPQ
jgi:hypothetical protein